MTISPNDPIEQASAGAATASAEAQPQVSGRFLVSRRGHVTKKPVTGPPVLSKLHLRLVELMVHGIDRPLPHFPEIEPHQPLPLEQAAFVCRMRLRHARELSAFPIFQTELNRQIAQLRNGAKAKAMHRVVQALDAPTNKAAERKVVLEAADRILGDDIGSPRSNGPQVNINIGAVEPGYVIRLPARAPAEQPRTIEHQPSSEQGE